MSFGRGRPEVSGIQSTRREQPLTDVSRSPASSATVQGQIRRAGAGVDAADKADRYAILPRGKGVNWVVNGSWAPLAARQVLSTIAEGQR
jgi:hypothetical protein